MENPSTTQIHRYRRRNTIPTLECSEEIEEERHEPTEFQLGQPLTSVTKQEKQETISSGVTARNSTRRVLPPRHQSIDRS